MVVGQNGLAVPVLFIEMDILLLSPSLEYRDCFEPLRMVWHDTARSGPQLCGQTAI